MAAARGLPGIPAQQVHQARHGVQVRPSAGQRRGPERQGHGLLRQYQGTARFLLRYVYSLMFPRIRPPIPAPHRHFSVPPAEERVRRITSNDASLVVTSFLREHSWHYFFGLSILVLARALSLERLRMHARFGWTKRCWFCWHWGAGGYGGSGCRFLLWGDLSRCWRAVFLVGEFTIFVDLKFSWNGHYRNISDTDKLVCFTLNLGKVLLEKLTMAVETNFSCKRIFQVE